jgi:hypothetical protein
MNDEAPRTQKLVDDLASAQKEVERIASRDRITHRTHQDEIGSLQNAISTKSSTIQQKESNLTVIGTYVDKLEERLAIAVTVAISRFASGNVKSSRQR